MLYQGKRINPPKKERKEPTDFREHSKIKSRWNTQMNELILQVAELVNEIKKQIVLDIEKSDINKIKAKLQELKIKYNENDKVIIDYEEENEKIDVVLIQEEKILKFQIENKNLIFDKREYNIMDHKSVYFCNNLNNKFLNNIFLLAFLFWVDNRLRETPSRNNYNLIQFYNQNELLYSKVFEN